MVEKVIHYCWFGENEKSELINRCIKSWNQFCPDYKIIEWNENNFDINLCKYSRQAYETKKYAFVSDVARLYIIYNYGGIYLDTDVELLDSLDSLLAYDGWFLWETERFINTGLGFAGQKNSKLIKSLLNDYINRDFYEINGKMDLTACIKLNTKTLSDIVPELTRDGKIQIYDNIAYLSPGVHKKISIHHAAASWTNTNDVQKNKEYKETFYKRFLRSPKIFKFIEKHFNDKTIDLYTILVYDVVDFGIKHFIKKLGFAYLIANKFNP